VQYSLYSLANIKQHQYFDLATVTVLLTALQYNPLQTNRVEIQISKQVVGPSIAVVQSVCK
jgi:hypothetical protein